ncbi:MBL fold metallo-hydrolase [Paenibacillus aceris]|uniref:Glyoxylase-like metal-dependent hydrolase (Beta-lactamase superfamily II) n=1 Tax=Paenibacillus aceris TaxID=869555 RepID=A0ABS4I074_9BACL|nr:MBL fold metallo-hydrolase [Paenibacillus aceris]MBP1963956.1 glyoxylase-like metal-dependent hydrolase (beta-lactamase superfamily II) [Paenibacillus aceris]NHW34625.1 MBL fold metallo-hydrolase [Paenibacillus aceris]
MKMTQKGSLYQVAFMPRFFPVNCYLVEEETELTLVDAALPFSVKGILEAAERIGKPITRIVLTHAHGDHVGALDGLKKVLPQAKVYISRRDAKLLAGNKELEAGEPNSPIKGDVPKSIQTKPDVLLEEGDRVGSLQAIAAPGHTPGSMAFLDVRSRALIAGDAFQVRGGVAVSGLMKLWFPFPAMATWNREVSLESAQKLRELAPSVLAVGHGVMIEQPLAVIDRAIEEAIKKFQLAAANI